MTSEVDCGSVDSTVESGEMLDLKKITINGIKSRDHLEIIEELREVKVDFVILFVFKTICFDGL